MKPGVSVGTRNAVMPRAWPGSPEVRAKTRSWVARCTPVLNRLAPLMTQPSPSALGAGLQPGGVGAVVRLGQPERHRALAGDQRLGPLLLLLRRCRTGPS